jgi:hypothetical protein
MTSFFHLEIDVASHNDPFEKFGRLIRRRLNRVRTLGIGSPQKCALQAGRDGRAIG